MKMIGEVIKYIIWYVDNRFTNISEDFESLFKELCLH